MRALGRAVHQTSQARARSGTWSAVSPSHYQPASIPVSVSAFDIVEKKENKMKMRRKPPRHCRDRIIYRCLGHGHEVKVESEELLTSFKVLTINPRKEPPVLTKNCKVPASIPHNKFAAEAVPLVGEGGYSLSSVGEGGYSRPLICDPRRILASPL